jgi:hypothetical protein
VPLEAIPISRPAPPVRAPAPPPPKALVPLATVIETPAEAVPAAGPPAAVPAAPATLRRQAVSPILAQVVALLRSPQAAGSALVLREIFDRPLCKRRR